MVAVLLAVLGIYSVIAFSAALRTHELAIRLALGAQRRACSACASSGAKLGWLGVSSAPCPRFCHPPLAFVAVQCQSAGSGGAGPGGVVIFLLALAASIVPARRAASIQPMQALRDGIAPADLPRVSK